MDGVMREPLRVRLHDEAQAQAVVRELAGIDGVAMEPGSGAWEVTVGDRNGDRSSWRCSTPSGARSRDSRPSPRSSSSTATSISCRGSD